MAHTPDRLSRLIWSMLEEFPDTFVSGSKAQIDLDDILLIKAYIERLEIQAGFSKEPTTQDVINSVLKMEDS